MRFDDDDDDGPLTGLLDMDAAAVALQVSRSALYRLISDGKIAVLKHGGKSRIERAEIKDYFARLRADASKQREARARRTRARKAKRRAASSSRRSDDAEDATPAAATA